jgi:hypothetical protein
MPSFADIAPHSLFLRRRGMRPLPSSPFARKGRAERRVPGALKFTQCAQTKTLGPACSDASRHRSVMCSDATPPGDPAFRARCLRLAPRNPRWADIVTHRYMAGSGNYRAPIAAEDATPRLGSPAVQPSGHLPGDRAFRGLGRCIVGRAFCARDTATAPHLPPNRGKDAPGLGAVVGASRPDGPASSTLSRSAP